MRLDTFGICLLLFAVAFTSWLGIAGPVYDAFKFNSLGDSAAAAAWAQAIVSGIAIGAVYVAATIPVRAEAQYRSRERRLQARGLALLIIPEMLVLKGELERFLAAGVLNSAPVEVSATLIGKTDHLYILDDIGARILQTIGLVNGTAAQVRNFQNRAAAAEGASIVAIAGMWTSVEGLLRLALSNVDLAIEELPNF